MTIVARVENLSKTYGTLQRPVLKDVNLSIQAGEFVAIMGPSGSGKSTLMHLMGGLDRATEGRAYLGEHCLNDLDDKELSRKRRTYIGFVFQFFNLIPVLSARENVAMPLILDGVKRGEALNRAEEMLDTVGLKTRTSHHPSELSGGEQQRVAIARALVTQPNLILADEPTGALDTHTGDEIVSLLRYTVDVLKNTVLMVTHDPRVAASARRIVTLRDGEIIDDNPMDQSGEGSGEIVDRLREKVWK